MIALSNFFTKIFQIGSFEKRIFDESTYIDAARGLISKIIYLNFEHPPLGKFIISCGITIFGDTPFGWRIASVIFSVAASIIVYLIAKRMFGGFFIPITSSILLLVETYWFVSSRLAMLDIFLATFSLAAILFLWHFFKEGKNYQFILSALFIGLAGAIKLNGFFLIIPLIIIIIYLKRKKVLIAIALAIIILTYLASYMPLYLNNSSAPGVLTIHQKMLEFQFSSRDKGMENIKENPISWFRSLPLTSIRTSYDNNGNILYRFFYTGNIIVLWLGLAAIFISIYRLFKEKSKQITFLLAIFALFLIPWIIIPGFYNVYLPLVPIVCLFLANWLYSIWQQDNFNKISVLLIILASIAFYILLLPRILPLEYQPLFIDMLAPIG
jgi:predicted membrane-bound dolichyl-phosphate-mannose-protein mannosyltransferase